MRVGRCVAEPEDGDFTLAGVATRFLTFETGSVNGDSKRICALLAKLRILSLRLTFGCRK